MMYYEKGQFFFEQNELGTRKELSKKSVKKILLDVFLNDKKLKEDKYGNPITVVPIQYEQEIILKQIEKLQFCLQQTDFIANNFLELISRYIVSGNRTELQTSISKYANLLEKRRRWRTEINFLSRKMLTSLKI